MCKIYRNHDSMRIAWVLMETRMRYILLEPMDSITRDYSVNMPVYLAPWLSWGVMGSEAIKPILAQAGCLREA